MSVDELKSACRHLVNQRVYGVEKGASDDGIPTSQEYCLDRGFDNIRKKLFDLCASDKSMVGKFQASYYIYTTLLCLEICKFPVLGNVMKSYMRNYWADNEGAAIKLGRLSMIFADRKKVCVDRVLEDFKKLLERTQLNLDTICSNYPSTDVGAIRDGVSAVYVEFEALALEFANANTGTIKTINRLSANLYSITAHLNEIEDSLGIITI